MRPLRLVSCRRKRKKGKAGRRAAGGDKIMIGYICLIYVGIKIGAAWWFYFLLALGLTCKFISAVSE
jgi:hypothetical protein